MLLGLCAGVGDGAADSSAVLRSMVGLAVTRRALIEHYQLSPPEAAVATMGLVEGPDGGLLLPNGSPLGMSVDEMYGDEAALVRLHGPDPVRDAGLPEVMTAVDAMLGERWSVDYSSPLAMSGMLRATEESSAALEVGMEMAMEAASPRLIAWTIADAGVQDAAD